MPGNRTVASPLWRLCVGAATRAALRGRELVGETPGSTAYVRLLVLVENDRVEDVDRGLDALLIEIE
jgi:hypothetical protein